MSCPSIPFPIDAEIDCDLLVVGGGVAAVCAAIAAARNGCDTCLVEMDQVLGGNGGPLLGVHVSGAHSFHPYASETGIIEELELEAARRRGKTRTWGNHYNISHAWDLVLQDKLAEAGVRLFRRHQGRKALVEGRRVTGVVVLDNDTFQTKLFRIRHGVIDGSGDGEVAASAGASFLWGEDARGTFGERSAPAVASRKTMGISLTALVRKCSRPVDFVLPPRFAERAAAEGPPPKLGGYPASWRPEDEFCFLWVTESGGQIDTIRDTAAIREEILYQLYRTWDNVKNHSFPELARNWELTWVSPKDGKRESRRFVGDHLLTQTEVENAFPFPDAIGYGGYGVDIHEVDGLRARVVFHSIPPLWSFPYRSCYSKDLDNLWLAGRLMSCSHLALGTVRLMRTLACIGQGAGTAAALARRHGCTAAEVNPDELQQTLLRQDATILTVPNRDPRDLARTAMVTATSEMRHGATRPAGSLSLDVPRGVQLWDWPEALRKVRFLVANPGGRERELTLRLQLFQREQLWKEERERKGMRHVPGAQNRMEWGSDNRLDGFAELAVAKAAVPARFDGWIEFVFPGIPLLPVDPSADENRYQLLFDACPEVSLGLDPHSYDFTIRVCRPEGADSYATFADCHAFALDPAPLYGEAANVTDGWNRRYSTNPVHAWLSDFDQPLPQSLELTFPTTVELARVQLTFDTIDRAYQDSPINCDEAYARRCVTAYRLEAETAAGWTTLAEESDNYQRWRVHASPPLAATRLRLTVLAVRDPRYRARVYEIRVYGPEA
ncbi:MAG: FAD-dependent oxidoreductase [Lentisphaeria bacterium]|jgi:hypothetical protein|nr:FAD-dependent oxidoreductase [Lentisphaeria bacterium]